MTTTKQRGFTQHHFFSPRKKSGAGFIALVSAVIISIVLLTLVVGVGERGFFSRFNILNSELKAMSSGLAEACVETAILFLAQDPNHFVSNPPPVLVPVGNTQCEITSVANGPSGPFIIKTHAVSAPIVTNTFLQVTIDNAPPNFPIQDWKECPDATYTNC